MSRRLRKIRHVGMIMVNGARIDKDQQTSSFNLTVSVLVHEPFILVLSPL
jgi:hypothetical protein